MEQDNQAKTHSDYPLKKRVRIYLLLCEGHDHSKVSRLVGCNEKYVRKLAKEYVDKGLLSRVSEKPATYVKTKPIRTTLKPVEHSDKKFINEPIMIPHKFGASFAQDKRPAVKFDERGKFEERTAAYTAQFGRYKCQVWLKGGFIGETVEEQIENGRASIMAIAQKLGEKYKVRLSDPRFYDDIEWVDPDKDRSKATAKGAKMKKGISVEVAGALHKLDKVSHENQIEFNALPGGEGTRPTDHAKIREFIYSGRLADTLGALGKNQVETQKILDKLTEVVVQIRQRMDIEAGKK